jgi:hypothetical protein
VGILAPTRRVHHRWPLILQLYDGRQCPDCGAIVCGREARRIHREDHMRRREWEEWVTNTIMQLARWTGHPVIDPARDQAPEESGGYEKVDLTAIEYDDEEEDYDDR